MKSHFVFLQAAPNAGVMQIVILVIFICVVLIIIKSFKNKKSHAIDLNSESSLENNTNSIIQAAGFELMKAGKNLITSVIILICLFPANIIIISIAKNVIDDPSNIMMLTYTIYFIICIFVITYLINGYVRIKRAGEIMFQNKI